MSRDFSLGSRLLTVEGLGLSYGPKVILRDVNLKVDNIKRPGLTQGQVVALLGPSGVGKTQLFKCLAGLQRSTSGKISYRVNPGSDKAAATYKEPQAGDVGVVFQSYPLLKHRTIWSNLKLAAGRHQKSDEDVVELMEKFGLTHTKNLYPSQISGGMRQRVAIIQQVLCSSFYILMDEPFSGLDPINKEIAAKLVLQVSQQNEYNTIIVTTHDIEQAVAIADTIWVLGRDRDDKGDFVPGAYLVKEYDLIARGLAWTSDVTAHPNFWPTVREIKGLFGSI